MKHNNSSFANPLKVVLNRVGEPSLAQYGAARTPLDSPQNAYGFWQDIVAVDPAFECEKEHLIAIMLDTKLRPKGYHVISVGTINETVAHPREAFRAAIVAAAYGIVLMHNHPSGDPSPSAADRRMTATMREAASILQINLIDHVIAGNAEGGRLPYFSFRDAGLL
jgi:DNA repair protein RadC